MVRGQVTPARAARDAKAADAASELGYKLNEAKYFEFKTSCAEGDVPACTSLGEWWAVMRHDYDKAAELYIPACLENRYPQACLNLGTIHLYGRGSYKKSVPDALRAFAVGCSEGSTDSCFEGGRALLGDANSHQRFVAWEAAQKSTAAGSTPAASSSTEAAAAGAPPAAPRRPVFRYQDAVSLGLDFLDRGCKAATSASAGRCCGLLAASYIAGFSRDAAAPAGGAVSGVDIPSLPAAGIKLTEAVSAAAAAAAAARAEELSGAGPGDGPRAESASLPAFTAAFPSRAGEILQYLTVACELEDADACMTLSKLFVRGLTTDGKAWLAPPAGSPAAAAPAPPLVPDPARAAQSFRQGLLWLGVAEKAADKEVEKRIKNGLFGAMPPATAPGAAKLQ